MVSTFVCKLCKRAFSTSANLVDHFDIAHRISKKSFFTCGITDCNAQFSILDAYNRHVSTIHSKSTSKYVENQRESASSASNDDPNLYKCPHSKCIYKANNKSSIRSHCFRQHPTASASSSPSVDVSTEMLISDDSSEIVCQDIPSVGSPSAGSRSDNSPDIDNCDLEEDILKSFSLIFLTLTSKYHVPNSTVQFIIDKYHVLLKKCSDLFKKQIITQLEHAGIDCTVIKPIVEGTTDNIVKLHGPQGPMRSSHMRHKQYTSLFKFVPPEGCSLGFNEDNIESVFHMVSIEKSLITLLEDNSVYQQIEERECLLIQNKDRSPTVYRDVQDGSLFRSHEIFSKHPNTIAVELFQDYVNMTNVLGSASGQYKLNAFYYSIANLLPWARSKVHAIQLISYCKEKDVAYFGFPRVLKPMFWARFTLTDVSQFSNKLNLRVRCELPFVLIFFLTFSGSDVVTEEPCCFVVVDKRILYREKLAPFEAFMSLFASYFVFKILYPPKVSALLEFIQRKVFKIDSAGHSKDQPETEKTVSKIDSGDSAKDKTKTDKTVNKKGRAVTAPSVNLKYLGFMRKLEDYTSLWSKKNASRV